MNLHQIDLNLLTIFDALYRHRSVSAAADEICLSQSAFSHGLSRLRKRLSDDLFVRINNVMQPTTLAHQLASEISPALGQIHSGLNANRVFEPSTSDIELTFAATDYTQFSLLPKLMAHIRQAAPKIQLTVLPSENRLPQEKLINNEIDFVLGFSHEVETSSTIQSQTWLTDSYCTIARKNHPQLRKGLSLDTFMSLTHIRISPWGEKQGVVDQQLSIKGLKRHVALQLPSVLASPYVVATSDLILTLPRLVASHLAHNLDIEIYQPPIAIPNYQLNLYCHKLNASKASHRWLSQVLEQL
ncbi:LysR family transcriptional regulator [uncultured Paraglaciecola sp.]|uniref:LysR family transcriptional regulator n=1 Tax=uncultured Paraglaciecola sp. TaxID=1765024 RepID=UPI002597DE1B|nr:LysR family transcriptional regulator [uncultured Paraglaciecola sp.]